MVPSRERYDVILIGGGIIGSSVAMGLAERGLKVAVVDIDLSGRLSSSEKNAGGVRATWWQPVNIALCRVSIGLYGTIRDEVGFRQKGYLWLYDAETWPKACDHIPLQRSLGHAIEMLTPEQVHQRVPEIDKLDRSEEHTSELQSRSDLVCRLLLEKKKKKNNRLHIKKKKKTTYKA